MSMGFTKARKAASQEAAQWVAEAMAAGSRQTLDGFDEVVAKLVRRRVCPRREGIEQQLASLDVE